MRRRLVSVCSRRPRSLAAHMLASAAWMHAPAASIVPHQGRQSLDASLNPAKRYAPLDSQLRRHPLHRWRPGCVINPGMTLATPLVRPYVRVPILTRPTLHITAYFVSFGPHGPRKPITASGQGAKTFAGVVAALGVTTGVFYLMRANGKYAPDPQQPSQPPSIRTTRLHPCPWHHTSNRRCPRQDHDQGVARGLQRDRARTEAEPHHRYRQRQLQGQGSRSVRISPHLLSSSAKISLFLHSSFRRRKGGIINLDRFAQHPRPTAFVRRRLIPTLRRIRLDFVLLQFGPLQFGACAL